MNILEQLFKILPSGSIIAEFTVSGLTPHVDQALVAIREDVADLTLMFGGNSVPAEPTMWVDGQQFFQTMLLVYIRCSYFKSSMTV